MMTDLNVSLSIEQLTIDGFSHNDALRVRGAFEQELQRMLTEQAATQTFNAQSCEQISCEIHAQSPEQIGRRAAQSLAQELVDNSWQND